MGKNRKILFLSLTDPRSCTYGGEQRTHHLWMSLRRVASVDVIIPVSHKFLERSSEVDGIRWMCFENRYSFIWVLQRLFSKMFPAIVLPWFMNKANYKRICAQAYDFVVAFNTRTAGYFAPWHIAKTLLDVDDYPPEMYATTHSKRSDSWFIWGMTHVVRAWGDWASSRCALCWVSNTQQMSFVKCAKVLPLHNIPIHPGMNYKFDAKPHIRLITIGYMAHEPNWRGVDKFIHESWRRIQKQFPEMEYHIVGKGLPTVMAQKYKLIPGVVVRGFVQDIDTEYEQCLAVVAPIYSGGGTCIKVAECLQHERPLFASEFALRGVPVTWLDGGGITIIDDDIVDAVSNLVQLMPSRPSCHYLSEGECSFESFSGEVEAGVVYVLPSSRRENRRKKLEEGCCEI